MNLKKFKKLKEGDIVILEDGCEAEVVENCTLLYHSRVINFLEVRVKRRVYPEQVKTKKTYH